MRPEYCEYNYDWLMGTTLNAAARVAGSLPKEIEQTYRYIPNYKRATETFINAEEPGIALLKLLARYYENILTAHSRGKKIAASTFCNSPAIFYAMDVMPVTFEVLTAIGTLIWKRGMFDYMDYCVEVGMPETSCSSQRGVLGAYLAGLCEQVDFAVCDTPGICDTNANAFAFASEYLDIPFYQLNYPSTLGDDRSQAYHVADYKALIRFIEEQTGKKMDYARLAEILKEINRQDALIADLEDMLLMVPTPIPPLFNLAIYAARFCVAGQKDYTELLQTLVDWGKLRMQTGLPGLKSGKEKLRVYMCYIDHYNVDLNFWNYFEERSIAHVGTMLSRNFREDNVYTRNLDGSGYGVDLSTPETMLDSIAQMNSRLPMVRSIRGPYDRPRMWLEESLEIARLYKADCLIYNGTPGCRNTWGMIKPFARDIEKQGYPVHIMYDDAFDERVESWEATRERLDEFFHVRGLL